MFNRVSNMENLINLKRKTALFKRAKKTEIIQKLNELSDKITPFTSSKELWAKVGRLTGRKYHQKENNIICDDREEAEKFLDHHFGATQIKIFEALPSLGATDLMSVGKWNRILNSKKKHSAPGEDRVSYEMLRSLSIEATANIVDEINKMWRNGCVSDALKTIKVIAIPKPGRNQNEAAGKRPISLVSTPAKIVNTAVLEQLQTFLEENHVIPPTSFGFRQNMSINTCLQYVINSIKTNKREKYVCAMICVDLSNAFNAVKVAQLEAMLTDMQVQREIVAWIVSFLTNRRILFTTNQGILQRTVSDGLPQGDVLSPTLFNVYTVGLHGIANGDTVLVQYADDFGIIVRAKNLEDLEEKAQSSLDDFVTRAEQLGFQINPEKTKSLLFTSNDKCLDVSINGKIIETVKSCRHLGVTLDRYISFGEHIRETRKKINDRLNMIKVINGTKHGSHPQVSIKIYNALVRSVVEYGSAVTLNAKKTNRHILTVATNQCLRKATGCTKSTPLNALAAIAGQDPLEHRLEYITGSSIARSFEQRNIIAEQLAAVPPIEEDGSDKYSYLENVYHKDKEIYDNIMRITTIPTVHHVEIFSSLERITGPKRYLPLVKLKQAALCVMNGRFKNRGRVFTDASKENNTCGIGIYFEGSARYHYRLAHEVSITTAEIQAINVAMKLIKENQLYLYVIYTDSKTACGMLEEALHAHKGPHILSEILQAAHETGTSIQWVPSHVGLTGNEMADQLAKLGTSTSAETLEHQIFYTDAKNHLKRKKLASTQEWYKNYSEEKGKHFYQIQNEYNDKPWYDGQDLKGYEVRMINRLMTAHNYSKSWLAKMKIVEDPDCELCEEPETAEHSIIHCPRFNIERAEFSFDGRYANLVDIFKKKDTKLCREVVAFVKKCKLDL